MNSVLVIVLLVAAVGFAECKPHLKESMAARLSQLRLKRGMYSGVLYGLGGLMELTNIVASCEMASLSITDYESLTEDQYMIAGVCPIAFEISEGLLNGMGEMEYFVDHLNMILSLLQCININLSMELVKYSSQVSENDMYGPFENQAGTMAKMCQMVYGNMIQEEEEFSEDMDDAEHGGETGEGDTTGEEEQAGEGDNYGEEGQTNTGETAGNEQQTGGEGASYSDEKRAVLLHLKRLLDMATKKN